MVESVIINSIKPEGYLYNLIGERFLEFLMDGFGRVYSEKGKIRQRRKVGKNLPPFPTIQLENSIKVVNESIEVDQKLRDSLSINRPAFSPTEGDLVSGFSGVQPKNRVVVKGKEVKVPHKTELSNGILKYESYRGIPLVEHILLRVAERVGFNTPASFVVVDRQLDKPFFVRGIFTGLVVERFDNEEGVVYLDLFGYLKENRFPNLRDKYSLTVAEIFAEVEKVLPPQEVEKLAQFFYFSFLVENGDLHLKNIGLIEGKDRKLRLTPFYDIINTGVYGFKSSLGLKLSKTRYKEQFTESELMEVLGKYLSSDIQKFKEEVLEQFLAVVKSMNIVDYPDGEKFVEELKQRYLQRLGKNK